MPKKGYQSPSTIVKPPTQPNSQERWTDVQSLPQTATYVQFITKEIEILKKLTFNWSIASNSFAVDTRERVILSEYIRCYHEYTEFDQFDSQFSILASLDTHLERIKDIDLIYKSFKLFRKCKWPVRFDSKFVSRFAECTYNQMKYVLSIVMLLADGYFIPKQKVSGMYGHSKPIQTPKSFPYNRFFITKCFKHKNLLIHIGVEKVPVVSRNNTIKRYQFSNYIQILDLLGDQIVENPKKIDERLKFFVDKILEDVAKKDHGDQLEIDQPKLSKNKNYFFYDAVNPYNDLRETFETVITAEDTIYSPLPFKVYYASTAETSTLIFDKNIKRWISKDYLDQVERKKVNEYQRKINEELVKRFVDFQSAKALVQLLTKIPNFKVNLTQQEKDVIGENGNVMVIGRSGTGKTTCAVLRLFSIEMLFKIRLSLYKKKFSSSIQNSRCSSDDIDQTMGLHCIFLTASPVLTSEIQRYYKKLTQNIKEELERKKRKVAEENRVRQKERQRLQAQENAIREQQDESSVVELVEQEAEQPRVEGQAMIQKQAQEFQNIQSDVDVPETIQRVKSKQVIQQESEMKEQLQGIQLKQNLQNQDFNQDEDFDRAKDEFQQRIKKFHSLQDLQQKDYPGFFTVKSYIMMLDGTLKKPFFIRGKGSNQVVEQQSAKAAWHNQRKGVMMIENYFRGDGQNSQQKQTEINQNIIDQIEEEINYSDQEELEHQYMRQIQLRANKQKQNLTKKLQQKKKKNLMSFQVDFDFFYTHFWPNVNRRFYSSRNITPQLVWTEIYSTIKGSASSHLYPGQYMPERVYLDQSQNVFLTKEEKLDIYQTFCQYERWKIQAGGYDIMDTVNYVLNDIRFRGYQGPEIHYVMIDQVQDLPHAMIYLLSKTALYGLFYSGDTAQTIAKGVGFRFCDLKSLFDPKLFDSSLNLKKPTVKHLTVNFRSHNNILQLANSIVSSLEILFPKTIDKLAKERSDLQGPKPMILAENDQEMLFYVLCGEDKTKQNTSNAGMKKPPLQFGCDQVIIVRDQQSKNKIPNMLQHALCLTIYEAKGLEFNDVILFNFFTECKSPEKWSLLKYLKVIDEEISKEEYERNLTRHNEEKTEEKNGQENEEELVDSECIVEQKDDNVKIKKIVSDIKKIMKDINDYAELCSDLKLLYTAITRPRKTLIIYDEDPTCRKLIEKMWENLGIIQIVTKSLIEEEALNPSAETNIFRKVVQATDKNEWKKQGLKMYSRGYFEQAMKCFEKSQHTDLFKKAKANLFADRATKLLIDVESSRNSIKQGFVGYKNFTQSQMSKLKKELKRNEAKSYIEFNQAAVIFESLSMYKQAGQCYFSGKKFAQAKQAFMKVSMIKQAAQSSEMLEEYEKAAQLYDRQGDYLKAIECLDLLNEWQQILKIIKKYESKMSEIQKSSLLKKYAALALEELVYEVQFENEDQADKEKKPQNKRIQVIKQKQSDEEDQDISQSSLSEEQSAKEQMEQNYAEVADRIQMYPLIQCKSEKLEQKQTPIEIPSIINNQQNGMLQSAYQQLVIPEKTQDQNDSFADLNVSNEEDNLQKQPQIKPMQEKQQVDQSSSSFADLNVSQDFSDLNVKYQKELDPDIQSIKSLADPEDPWIRSVISEIAPKSEYSIIDESQCYNTNAKIIKTKGNIFIQDQIMEKIIRIVSIINSSSTTFLQQFKGYQSLITINKSDNQQNQIKNVQITDFEDIDSQTINIILDTLESFKLYKLCLFVCNRYYLPQKAGRYLISIMMKYSTNCQANTIVSSGLLAPSSQRKTELQKGIFGSIAVHSILENVNSEFLKIKISSSDQGNKQKNTLGTYFIQGLILEGFFKKTVFITNPQESLHILENFSDYELFRELCINKFLKIQKSQTNIFLAEKPKTEIEMKFSLITLKDVIGKYQAANKMEMISYRYYKEFGLYDKINFLKDCKIPEYLPFTKNIIAQGADFYAFLDKQLPLTYQILIRGNEMETADAVLGLLCILHSEDLEGQLFQKSSLKSFLQYYQCIKLIRNVIHHLDGPNALNIIRSVLTFYQCKLIENYKSMGFLGSGYCFMSRTSNMANELIEEVKNHPETFAYFFEQDFNYIMVNASLVMRFIKERFNVRLSKFLGRRVALRRFSRDILPDDYLLHNEELVVIDALKQAIIQINNKEVKTTKNSKKTKDIPNRPQFDYKAHGKIQASYIFYQQQLSQDEQTEQQLTTNRARYVLPMFTHQLTYLKDELLSIFSRKIKQSQDVAMGRELYCANLNSYYREYVDKIGGYNLYDAIEFKKFKQIDMYADNILSLIDTFPLIDKHVFLTEILILLLIEYKKLSETKKNFTIELNNCYLKYLQDLKFVKCLGHDDKSVGEFQMLNSDDLHESIHVDRKKFIFSYDYPFASNITANELMEVICDYLDVLVAEEKSQFANLSSICQMYVINLQPNAQNQQIFCKLRKTITTLGKTWGKPFYQQLIKAKNHADFVETRRIIIKKKTLHHQIKVTCTGNSADSITESQRDYEIQTRIINGRKKALNKIMTWWKKNKISSRQKLQKRVTNYFDYMIKNQDPQIPSISQLDKNINNFRILQKTSDCNLTLNVPLLLNIEKTREDLLKFYLKNIVSSSLDFHYILITLRKIENLRELYVSLCKELQTGIVQRDIHSELSSISESINDLQSNINTWKTDEKWLKEKHLAMKKKKVFEVKWMTKSLNQMKIIRKRAGLKKQEKLQLKKKIIKS